MPLLWIVAVMAIFGVIFYGLTVGYTGYVVKRLLERHHRDAEFVLATHRAPQRWSRQVFIRLPSDARRKQRYLRKLSRLRDYLTRTPMIESEAVRNQLVQELDRIREEWTEARATGIEVEHGDGT